MFFMSNELCTNIDGLFIVQGSMFAVTLYDTVYLYLKLASEVLNSHGNNGESKIKDGTYMYQRAKNYLTKSSEYCFVAIRYCC